MKHFPCYRIIVKRNCELLHVIHLTIIRWKFLIGNFGFDQKQRFDYKEVFMEERRNTGQLPLQRFLHYNWSRDIDGIGIYLERWSEDLLRSRSCQWLIKAGTAQLLFGLFQKEFDLNSESMNLHLKQIHQMHSGEPWLYLQNIRSREFVCLS